ncbi:MAG TPA: T9SS type A sorting domain-containing protein [Bacteroidetes bacterium]|nr:T9SS type A sorting domain-containing protein [Bacteroidota bacterium]
MSIKKACSLLQIFLTKNNVDFNILIGDVSKYYVQQNRSESKKISASPIMDCAYKPRSFNTPDGFGLGSMGGFFTYQEMLDHLDTMSARYPNLITYRDTLNHRTREGRSVYWLKISNKPNIDENEPEILYDALHHAREPNSLSQLIFYMYYLLENYGNDEEVTYLLDNLEMYFVPCINPDGYIYNEITNPNGGGMWRKNRRNNGNGKYGVDLNRNYGHNWGYDNSGSSPNPASETYRGDTAFSEPETQNMRDFCEGHDFQLALNYHVYGDLLIYPWGYDYALFTPDSAEFVAFSMEMTKDNKFFYGTGDQTVGYIVNGDSDDWMYGEQTSKNKIFSMTPESGPSNYGFWPPSSEIERLCKETLWQNLASAYMLLNYGIVKDQETPIISDLDSHINYSVRRLGLLEDTFTINIIPFINIDSIGVAKEYVGMYHLEERSDSIRFWLNSSIASGDSIAYVLDINNGNLSFKDTIYKIYGNSKIIFEDYANNLTQWDVSGSWDITNKTSSSPPSSITDSPNGFHANNLSSAIKTKYSIDLRHSTHAYLEFKAKWQLEQNYDFVQVFIEDKNANQTPLCSYYSNEGTSSQDLGQPVFDGAQLGWVRTQIDLSPYTGDSFKLGFIIYSDNYTEYDGFYFDDVIVYSIDTMNALTNKNMESTDYSLMFYPNPIQNNLFVNVNALLEEQILYVTNALGKNIFSRKINQNDSFINIDTKAWGKGLYFIYLQNNKSYRTPKKIIKY